MFSVVIAYHLAMHCFIVLFSLLFVYLIILDNNLNISEVFPLWLSSLRTQSCCSFGIGCRCSSALALLWLWHRPAAAAPIWPRAQELPYATGTATKRKKNLNVLYFLSSFQDLMHWGGQSSTPNPRILSFSPKDFFEKSKIKTLILITWGNAPQENHMVIWCFITIPIYPLIAH